jgi:transcriptional regulator with XRE-family HTH domain
VAKDWDAVAAAIRARLVEIDMTQAELAARAGVALMTVRELQHNLQPRRRNPRTLAAVSEALGWPADRLAQILEGGGAAADVDSDDPVLRELDAVKEDLTAIVRRLDAIERRLGPAGEPS